MNKSLELDFGSTVSSYFLQTPEVSAKLNVI